MDIIPQLKSITKDGKQKGKDHHPAGEEDESFRGTLVLHTSHEHPLKR